MIAKAQHRAGIVHGSVLPGKLIKENGRHRSYVLVTEPQVGAGKTGVTRFHCLDSDAVVWRALLVDGRTIARPDHVPGKNLLGQSHGPCGAGVLARDCNRRQRNFPLHARYIELKQPSILDDLARDVILGLSENRERNLLARSNLVDQRKICRSEHAQVLAILLVNTLNILGNDDLYAGAQLGIRRLLAARSLAAPLPADGSNKTTPFHVSTLNGNFIATFQAGVRKLAQGFVEEKTNVSWGNFVGRNIIAQLGIVPGIAVVPWKVLSRQLPLDQLRIFGKKQNPSLKTDSSRSLVDFLLQQG